MNGPDADGFWEAMRIEVETLNKKRTWDLVEQEDWMNVVKGTWAFKYKRYPSGVLKKLKARWCARGDTQIEGVDYFDTFAPVVNKTTVRMLLQKTENATKHANYSYRYSTAESVLHRWKRPLHFQATQRKIVHVTNNYKERTKVIRRNGCFDAPSSWR